MKKTIFTLSLLFIFSHSAFANNKIDFPNKKRIVLETIAKRKLLIQNEELCVNNSQNEDQLKQCFHQTIKQRESLKKEINEKINKEKQKK